MRLPMVITVLLFATNPIQADVFITEAMSDSASTPDWFELTNTGSAAVSLANYKMDDNSFASAKAVALQGIDSIQPGESVVFLEGDAAKATEFITEWGAAFANLKVGYYSGSGVGLGKTGDGIIIFANSTEVTRRVLGSATSNSSFRWEANLNALAEISQLNDSHGSKHSKNSNVGSPCRISAPQAGNQAPYFENLAATHLTGVVGDNTDFYANTGLVFKIADLETPASQLAIQVTSSNTTVAQAQVVNDNGQVTLKVFPSSVGYADLTLTVTDPAGLSKKMIIAYAASSANTANTTTRWLNGRSDLSTIIRWDESLTFVADDEPKNTILAYDIGHSGPAIQQFILADSALNTNSGSDCAGVKGSKCDGESDLEAAVQVGQRIIWVGSHSNNKNGKIRPDRWRLLATEINGSGTSINLATAGYYKHLRTDLVAWDEANSHGLGVNYLGLKASTALNLAPESANLDGFSIEGLTMAPDNTTGWLGFRAPLVNKPGTAAVQAQSTVGRTHALIIPVSNLEQLASAQQGGNPSMASIGQPIRLDLGGRGIREIQKNSNGEYLILAGPPDSANGIAPKDFRLYVWDGQVNAQGEAVHLSLREANLTSILAGMPASPEGLVDLPARLLNATADVTVLSDTGDVDFYQDTQAAKDLAEGFRKGRVDSVNLGDGSCSVVEAPTKRISPSLQLANNTWTMFGLPLDAGAQNQVQHIFNELPAAQYDRRWRVFEVDNTNQRYNKLALTSPLTPGKAYWIITLNGPTTITFEGTPIVPNGDCRVDLAIHPAGYSQGENALANPTVKAVNWGQVLLKQQGNYLNLTEANTNNVLLPGFIKGPTGTGKVGSTGYTYSSLQTQGSIEPWQAFWVKAKSAVGTQTNLSIPLPADD